VTMNGLQKSTGPLLLVSHAFFPWLHYDSTVARMLRLGVEFAPTSLKKVQDRRYKT